MSRHRLTVVLSQAPGKHPAKRALEEAVVAALIMEPGLDVSVIPNLYDLNGEHTGRLFLESVQGDMVVLSWLYPRAAYWLLDRDGIKGLPGQTKLQGDADDLPESFAEAAEKPQGIGAVNVPGRYIYCLDLRHSNSHEVYVAEVRRLAAECRTRRQNSEKAGSRPFPVELGLPVSGLGQEGAAFSQPPSALEQALPAPNRRWYPVIDYSRCTNCMECLDFCLFGVYGVDNWDRLVVESQDNCKRGCPACSRVCPEGAIMFPDFKTPAIAGAPGGDIAGLKIDLTQLFGGDLKEALAQAIAERDRELETEGRQAVGRAAAIPKRRTSQPQGPKDDLDKLMDSLDSLDL